MTSLEIKVKPNGCDFVPYLRTRMNKSVGIHRSIFDLFQANETIIPIPNRSYIAGDCLLIFVGARPDSDYVSFMVKPYKPKQLSLFTQESA